MRAATVLSTQTERSQRRAPPAASPQAPATVADDRDGRPGVPQFLEARRDAGSAEAVAEADAGGAPASTQIDAALTRSSERLDAGLEGGSEEQEEAQDEAQPAEPEPAGAEAAIAAHHGPAQSEQSPPGAPPLERGEDAPGGAAGAGSGAAAAGGEAGDGAQEEAGDAPAPAGEASAAGAAEGGAGAAGEGAGGAAGGSGGGRREGTTAGAGPGGEISAEATLAALASGDIALIDEELAEHQRWGTASARVGSAGSARRADFIVDQAGAGALGGLGHGALMGAAVGAGSQVAEIAAARGAARLVGRLAAPALARTFPLPAIGAVIGGVFSAYDLATRDWGQSGETIGRFGEGASIYEQLANSIAAVSEIIGIATAVLNVIAGVIGAISIAMWVITVLTVGVASPLAATLSTIAMAIGLATMVLDGINALVLQRLVTLFRALHTFTSQADPREVEQQGGRIGAAAAASAGFVGGVAGGVGAGGATAAGARRLGVGHTPPRVPDVEPPHAAAGDGPTITADPPPPEVAAPAAGDRQSVVPPEPVAPRAIADTGAPTVETPAAAASPAPPVEAAPPPPSDASTPAPAASSPADAERADLAAMSDADIDVALSALDAGEAVVPGNMYEIDANGLVDIQSYQGGTGQSSSRAEPGGMIVNQGRGSHNENIQFAGGEGATVTVADAGAVPVGGQGAGESVIPAGAGTTIDIPSTTITITNADGSSTTYAGGNMSIRTHSPNPGAPPGSHSRTHPTTQGDTPRMPASVPAHLPQRGEFGGGTITGASGRGGEYLMPGQQPGVTGPEFHPMAGSTPQQRADAHMPVTEVAPIIDGPPSSGGAPTAGPSAPPVAPTFSTRLGATPETPSVPPPSPTRGGGAPLPVAETRASAEGGAPTRGTTPLTPEQFGEFAGMAEEMGMPREQIQQVAGPTAYLPGSFDQLLLGPDIVPRPPEARPSGLANPANAALEPRAVLGHEIIGHREAELAGQARIEPWHEEFQASTRAALHTPDLPREQMWLLTQDAAARRRHQTREGTIFVDTERYGGPEGGARAGSERPSPRSRPSDQRPSVIVDPAVAGGRRVAESDAAIQPLPGAAVRPPLGGVVASSAAVRSGPRGGAGSPAGGATRDERVARGGGVGAVVGGIGGGPLGAYVGRRVGEGVARRAEDFNAGLTRGAEPVVEQVNPAYPPPPGSGSRQEIADMQNSLLAILQARAQAETLQGMMADDAAHHEGNSAPLSEFNERNAQALTATQAHQQATARRTAANQQQQQQEGNVSGALSDYGNRAAGLTMITGPLEAFTRFTYLANALPDSPNVLRGAKRGILKMNSDGQSFLDALNGVDRAVGEQQGAQPARSAGVTANAGRLAATASGAGVAQAQLGQSGSQGQALAARNAARAGDSRQCEAAAAQTGAQLDTQAEDTQTRITTLAEQWQAWAVAHRQARVDAMASTRAAMIARGWRPRAESGSGAGS